jgi:hypothetical protein
VLPFVAEQAILDVAVLGARQGIRPVQVHGARVPQAGLFHDPPGAGVHRHGGGHDLAHPEIGERQAHQGQRALGGVPLSPGAAAQPVAEAGDAGIAAGVGPVLDGTVGRCDRPQHEPPDELAVGAGFRGPVPEPGEAQVAAGEVGQHLVADLRQRLGGAGQEEHDLRIPVQAEQFRRVGGGEPAQRQALGEHGRHASD